MRSYAYQILSLTTVTVVSFATSDGLNSNARDVIQSLTNSPGSQGQWDNPALGFDTKSAINDWREDADTNNSGTEQPLVAESNDHGCSRANKRRRGNIDYCPSYEAPPQFRPSSQQEDPQTDSSQKKTEGSSTELDQQPNSNTQTDGGNLLAPSIGGENNCPARYRIPICATSKLEPDPTHEGGWRRERWDESAASDLLFQQDFCRICSLIQTLSFHSKYRRILILTIQLCRASSRSL